MSNPAPREPLDCQEVVQVDRSTYELITALRAAYGGISRAAVCRMAFARAFPRMKTEMDIMD